MLKIDALADAAKPIDEDEYGSERQVKAEIDLYNFICKKKGEEYAQSQVEKVEGSRMTIDEAIEFLRNSFKKS